MNQNQKISIVDDPKLRKEIALKIAEKINELPKIKNKITEKEIDDLINDQAIVHNYHLIDQIKQKIDQMVEVRENNSEIISIGQTGQGNRFGYILYENMETEDDKVNSREFDLLTENVEARQKLINNLIINELNMDLSLLFPKSETEALEKYKNNIGLLESGFLFTPQDLLFDLENINPKLNTICKNYIGLFQGNYPQGVVKSYQNISKALIPTKGRIPEEFLAMGEARDEIVKILKPYENQIKELEAYSKLPDDLSKKTYTNNLFMTLFTSGYLEKGFPGDENIKIMYKDNILTNNMPLTKVFKDKDGKVISLKQAAQSYNVKTKSFNDDIQIVDIDPAEIKAVQDKINLDSINSNVIYYKHMQYELKNKDYKGTYNELNENINQYLKQYNEIKGQVEEIASNDPSKNKDALMIEKMSALSSSPEFQNIEKSIRDELFNFHKDILDTNKSRKDLDFKIKKLYQFNIQQQNVSKTYDPSNAIDSHEDYPQLVEELNNKIKEIEEKKAEILSSGDKDAIRKSNEYYYEAYDELIKSDIQNKISTSYKSYSKDVGEFKNYIDDTKDLTMSDYVNHMKHYVFQENPQTEFDKQRLDQMDNFIKLYDGATEDEREKLKDGTEFKLAKRILAIHHNERKEKEKHYLMFYNQMKNYRSLSNSIKENEFMNDYSLKKLELDQFIKEVDKIEKDYPIINKDAQSLDVKTDKLLELFSKDSVKNFLNEIDDLEKDFKNEKALLKLLCVKTSTKDRLMIRVNKFNYKTCAKLAQDVMNTEYESKQTKDEHLDKYNELKENYPNDPLVSQLPKEPYRKNNEEYLADSLKELSVMNLKHQEYQNRGAIGKWWYKNSHNAMLETRANLISQLTEKGVMIKNLQKLGLDDKENSYARALHREIHREDIMEKEINEQIEKIYDEKINKKEGANKNLQIKIKGEVDVENVKDVSNDKKHELENVHEQKAEKAPVDKTK